MELSEAVKLVSFHPAQAGGIDQDDGSIQVGKKADLILVESFGERTAVRYMFIDGHVVYGAEYHWFT